MKKIDLGQTITLLANVGVIAGIVFLGYELRQNSETMRIQAAQIDLNSAFELDLLIAQDEGLMELLFTPVNERSAAETFQYGRFASAVLQGWQNSFYLNEQGVLRDDLWAAQSRYISSLLGEQADFLEYWQANRTFYTPRFNAFLDELLGPPSVE